MKIAHQLALTGAVVIDGNGGKPDIMTVLVKGGEIHEVIPGKVTPEGWQVVDLSGKYLMPGIIEMHGHFYANRMGVIHTEVEAYSKLFLAGGVTTVRSAGEKDSEEVINWRDDINAGEKTGPRILTAGEYLNRDDASGNGGWMNPCRTIEELLQMYMAQKDNIDQVKIYNKMPADWIERVTTLAHSHGLKVYGHLGACTARDAILAGIDGLEHGPFNMPEFYDANGEVGFGRLSSFDPDSKKSAELVALIAERQTAITPTFAIIATDGVGLSNWIDAHKLYRYFGGAELKKHIERRNASNANHEKIAIQDEFMERSYLFINKLYNAGGKLFLGTDPVYPMITPGYGLIWETEFFIKCGISPSYIIRALTSEAAKQLDVFNITGSIEPGKKAELIILAGNPLENISNLYDIITVIKDGIFYEPEVLRSSVDGYLSDVN